MAGSALGILAFWPWSTRSRQDSFHRPPEVKPILNLTWGKPRCFRPFHDQQRFSVVRQFVTAPPIAGLFAACCPSAIGRFIVAIVILAFDLVRFRWTLPHVLKECFKRLSPASTNGYPPSCILGEANIARGLTSANHRPPACISRGVRHSVRNASLRRCFSTKASAALLLSRRQAVAVGERRSSARARALPDHQRTLVAPCESEHCQSRKRPSGKVRRSLVELRRSRGVNWIHDRLNVLRHRIPLCGVEETPDYTNQGRY